MMKLVAALLVASACGASKEPMPPPAERKPVEMPAAADVAPLATASNTLAFELWAKAAPTGNAAMSPASITTALAMAWGGASGATAEQMRGALHLTGDPATTMAMWGRLASALQDPRRAMTLRIANRLFGQKDYPFVPAYLDRTRESYGAPLEPLDFLGAPEPARTTINRWVEDETSHRIKDLLPPRSITTDTRLVLVNAIYFLADWASKFEPRATAEAPFHASKAESHPVPMMNQEAWFKHARADGVSVLELPYQGAATAMLVILPDAIDGLATVERTLDAATLARWRGALESKQVEVALPKFTIDPPAALELSGPLIDLGMRDAFDPHTADFTGIAVPPDPEKRLFISKVFHKAFVKVDEKGTEAAAATAIVMADGAGAAPSQPERFTADHPFLFAIVDQATGLILFLGRVAQP
jgi:serine protease inhibitor